MTTKTMLGLLCACLIGGLITTSCDKKDSTESPPKEAPRKEAEQAPEPEPVKTLTKEQLETVLATAMPGFTQQPGAEVQVVMDLPTITAYYMGEEGNANDTAPFVQLRVHACGHCPPLDVAAFEAEEGLFEKMMRPTVHKENPDAVLEIKKENLGGRDVVTLYQLSFVVSEDGASRASSHSFSTYLHDGTTMLHVMVTARGVKGFQSIESAEQLANQLTRAEMATAAAVFIQTLAPQLFD